MKLRTITLILAISPAAAQAEVRSYDCELHSIQAQGWIPSRVIFSVDAENNQARVLDGAVMAANELAGRDEEMPMNPKLKATRKGEYQLSWRLTLPANNTRQLRAAYTAKLNPADNSLSLRAKFPMDNVANRPGGVGDCKPITSRSLF
ncbi:hypothetical protein [uncultured Ruegeria sp.]|uniref:hypothetical protein n=1 Tax=uncultured Ruegeria sp. TaxID=259304 RepID=UPI002601AEF0|nr:hypothetical protein [uncultured Ruegeria sp.]